MRSPEYLPPNLNMFKYICWLTSTRSDGLPRLLYKTIIRKWVLHTSDLLLKHDFSVKLRNFISVVSCGDHNSVLTLKIIIILPIDSNICQINTSTPSDGQQRQRTYIIWSLYSKSTDVDNRKHINQISERITRNSDPQLLKHDQKPYGSKNCC